MRTKHIALLMTVLGLAWSTAEVAAQTAPAMLSLEDALSLARRHNPSFQAQANDEAIADWNLRASYGSLLPTLSASGRLGWAAGGAVRVGDVEVAQRPDQVGSSYGLNLGWGIDGGTFFNLARDRANRAATIAGVDAAEFTLGATVTRQYLMALRARDAVVIAQRELASATEALNAAQTRVETGAAMRLDAAQAEVTKGQAEVAVLQAQATEESERLRLLQAIGVDLDQPVTLSSTPVVFEPKWTLKELTDFALAQHPQIVAARATESAGKATARAAKMTYLPRISVGGGWGGYTAAVTDENFLVSQAEQQAAGRIASCEQNNDFVARLARPLPSQDCSQYTFTAADRDAIIKSNSMFPFNFTKDAPSFGLNVSLPIFDGFSREAQLMQANAVADDAKHRRREQELETRTTVATSYLALQTAHRAVAIQERNAATAAEQFELASERYRLGAGNIVELTQAQATRAQAEQAHLAAVYAFHENLAALEAAVGRTLR